MEQIALVTGSSRGIGRAVAAELARKGWAVCVNYRVRQDCAEELVRQQAEMMRDQLLRQMSDESKKRVERMEQKVEDQLAEGGFRDALSAFFDDLVTFPFAVMKGPVMRSFFLAIAGWS